MIKKEQAQSILSEIKQHIASGIAEDISFSSQTILWMAESLVAAIDEVEKVHREQETAVKAITIEKEQAVVNLEKVKEEYFKLLQNLRKAETTDIVKKSKGRLLKKWRNEPK